MNEKLQFLEKFADITTYTEGNKYPTLSLLCHCARKLLSMLATSAASEKDYETATILFVFPL